MRATTFITTTLTLLAGNALASGNTKMVRTGFKKLPGDTELAGCGDNSKLTPQFAEIKVK